MPNATILAFDHQTQRSVNYDKTVLVMVHLTTDSSSRPLTHIYQMQYWYCQGIGFSKCLYLELLIRTWPSSTQVHKSVMIFKVAEQL